MSKETLYILFLALNCALIATPVTGAETEKSSQEDWWSVDFRLEHSILFPPAVQWTVVDQDPVQGFIDRVSATRAQNAKDIDSAKTERKRRLLRSVQMMVDWDRGFKSVSGDKLYLMTDSPSTFTSDSHDGKKWIITKVVTIQEEPTCWCIPVETQKGTKLKVTLTDTNTFDISSAYETGMTRSPQDKDLRPAGKP